MIKLSLDRLALLAASVLLAAGLAASAAAQQAPPAAKTDESRGGWRSACAQDLKDLCRRTSGGSAKRLCLNANLSKVSQGCQAALNERRQQRAEALRACGAELQSLCKDVVGSNGAKLQCLHQKTAEATPACAQALSVVSPARSGKTGAAKN